MTFVVSISLGSAEGNFDTIQEFLGVPVRIVREGTNGDLKHAAALIRRYDGHADAIGLGGVDRFLVAPGGRRYELHDGRYLARQATRTPVVDGSGIKDTLERDMLWALACDGPVPFAGKRALIVSALDRFGMAEVCVQNGASIVCGDYMFCLGIDWPVTSLRALALHARLVLPLLRWVPIRFLYPTGAVQTCPPEPNPRFSRYFHEADILLGDSHLLCRHLPDDLSGKLVVTNTLNPRQIRWFAERRVRHLVSTTPSFGGRTPGTNVLEAVLVALLRTPLAGITHYSYDTLLAKLNFEPTVIDLAPCGV